jgi:hypothetical protein
LMQSGWHFGAAMTAGELRSSRLREDFMGQPL